MAEHEARWGMRKVVSRGIPPVGPHAPSQDVPGLERPLSLDTFLDRFRITLEDPRTGRNLRS